MKSTRHEQPVAGHNAKSTEIVLVVAVGENGVIGRDGALPWRLSSDLKHFRAITWGKPIIMGRRTFASIKRPLPGRTNIVVSRDANFHAAGSVVAPTLPAALAVAEGDALRRGAGAIAVIGGGEIYAQMLPIADQIALTLVRSSPPGDAVFPPIDPDIWQEIDRTEHQAGPDDEAAFAHVIYRRAAAVA